MNLTDELKKFYERKRKEYEDTQIKVIVQGKKCNFACPAINMVITHNYKNLNNFILEAALSIRNSNPETIDSKIIHFDLAEQYICDDPNFIMSNTKYNYIKVDKSSDVQELYDNIKLLIDYNSIIVITNLENLTFRDIDPNTRYPSPQKSKIINQLFRRFIPKLYETNSMIIIGHTSDEYARYSEGKTIVSPPVQLRDTSKEIHIMSFMPYLCGTINKIVDCGETYKIEELL
jgi:hypothetical protein